MFNATLRLSFWSQILNVMQVCLAVAFFLIAFIKCSRNNLWSPIFFGCRTCFTVSSALLGMHLSVKWNQRLCQDFVEEFCNCWLVPLLDAGIHLRDFFVMLRDMAHISFVWLLSYGLLQLPLLFIVQLSDIKQMLKIWSPCFTCMFGVCNYPLQKKILLFLILF